MSYAVVTSENLKVFLWKNTASVVLAVYKDTIPLEIINSIPKETNYLFAIANASDVTLPSPFDVSDFPTIFYIKAGCPPVLFDEETDFQEWLSYVDEETLVKLK